MSVASQARRWTLNVPSLFLQLHLILPYPRCHTTNNMDLFCGYLCSQNSAGLSYVSFSKSKSRVIEFYASARKKICWNLIIGASQRVVNSYMRPSLGFKARMSLDHGEVLGSGPRLYIPDTSRLHPPLLYILSLPEYIPKRDCLASHGCSSSSKLPTGTLPWN